MFDSHTPATGNRRTSAGPETSASGVKAMVKKGLLPLICLVLLNAMCAAGGQGAGTDRTPTCLTITSLRFYYWADRGGVDVPSCEYGKGIHKELTEWTVGGGPAPDKFDVVVTVLNKDASRTTTTVVNVQRRYKVGPFVADRQYGMTDYERGYRDAKWTRYVRIVAQKITLKPHERKSVIIPIDFGKVFGRYSDRNRWPWFLQVKAWIDPMRPVVRKLETVAGD